MGMTTDFRNFYTQSFARSLLMRSEHVRRIIDPVIGRRILCFIIVFPYNTVSRLSQPGSLGSQRVSLIFFQIERLCASVRGDL